MAAQADFQQRFEVIERLIQQIEAASDPHLRKTAKDLVQAVMDLHGTTIERMLEIVHASGDPGQAIIDTLAGDDLVSSVLVLHGLHPLGVEDRVRRAVDKVAARVGPNGGAVELLSIEDGAVRVMVRTKAHGHGSAQALKKTVEDAIYQAAPDITALEVEGAEDGAGFVPLSALLTASPPQPVMNGRSQPAGEGAR